MKAYLGTEQKTVTVNSDRAVKRQEKRGGRRKRGRIPVHKPEIKRSKFSIGPNVLKKTVPQFYLSMTCFRLLWIFWDQRSVFVAFSLSWSLIITSILSVFIIKSTCQPWDRYIKMRSRLCSPTPRERPLDSCLRYTAIHTSLPESSERSPTG